MGGGRGVGETLPGGASAEPAACLTHAGHFTSSPPGSSASRKESPLTPNSREGETEARGGQVPALHTAEPVSGRAEIPTQA